MFFITPMWDNESQRIGKMKCTPLGYKLHIVSDLFELVGLLSFIGIIIFLGVAGVLGYFKQSYLWLLLIPLALDIFGTLLHLYSWHLAYKNGFEYNDETRESSWIEDEKRIFYRWKDEAKT